MKKKLIGVVTIGIAGVVAFNIFTTFKNKSIGSFSKNYHSSFAEKKDDLIIASTDTDGFTINNEEDNKVDLLENTTYEDENGNLIVKNTNDILVLANKQRNLPSDYKPEDLVIPNVRFPFEENLEKKYLRREAAEALEELFDAADNEGISLFAISGYRSYNTQKMLFENKSNKVGTEKANLLVAYPGQSEHQTGLAIDVSSQNVGFALEESFGQVKEGQWLEENAHNFGFIIRYQKETTDITGYSYEPWHIRYVGKETAKEIFEKNITLEEYLRAI
ncbi:D-alanyl-D-alanine carboxypeptidase family protein [Tissierella pigra]|nr:M15 family metallopeptidase [Tissierella pigra]